jgi:hypothetical protein
VEPCVTPASSLLSDLMKIGIPSLVAVASAYYSYRLGRAGHQKDILIENIRSNFDKSRTESEKKSALVIEIVAKISAVENAMGRHSGVFRSENIKDETTVTSDVMAKVRAVFNDVEAAIDGCTGARAQVDLLGDQKLSAQFTLFLESLFTFQNKARPEENMDPFDLMDWFANVSRQKEPVLKKLSDIHLGK